MWRSRDTRRRLFDLTFEAGFAGAVDHTCFSLFVLRTALATFLLLPVAFVQGQTLTLNDAIKLAETHNRALQVAQLDLRKAADETSVAIWRSFSNSRTPSNRSLCLPVFHLARCAPWLPCGS